jgi:magnesium transporter
MRSWIEHEGMTLTDPDPAMIREVVTAGRPFWLDIERPTDEVIDRLAAVLDLHDLAIEDSKQFDQRGKFVVYDDLAMVVGFGLDAETLRPIEVHAYIGRGWLVTMRQASSDAIDSLHRSMVMSKLLEHEPIKALHQLINTLHDDYPPYIAALQQRLTTVEEEMIVDPQDRHLAEITEVRRAAELHGRVLTPGRDLAVRTSIVTSIPGASADAALYASDIADEMRLIVGDLAAIGDRCLAALGLHASLMNNRQAAASRQLAAVATVFLPITFVVGFFGMNFDVLVNDFEQGWVTFVLFGVVLNVAGVVVTLWWLSRRGWR